MSTLAEGALGNPCLKIILLKSKEKQERGSSAELATTFGGLVPSFIRKSDGNTLSRKFETTAFCLQDEKSTGRQECPEQL